MVFYQYLQGGLQPGTMSLEQVFSWNIRFQVLVRNQEEKDLLSGYQLMFGREIQIVIWDDWLKEHGPQEIEIGGTKFTHAGGSLLPITFATFEHDMRPYT